MKETVENLIVNAHKNSDGVYYASALINGELVEEKFSYKPKNSRARQNLVAKYRKSNNK